MFFTAEPQDILGGKVTDVYFERALKVLEEKGINPAVKAEFIAKSLPDDWKWALFTGIEEAAGLLKHLKVRVRAMQEGTVFYPYEPVMEIEGQYRDFILYETAILGLLCQASGVATKASRVKKLAGDRLVMSFGARRMHPMIAPMIERNAFIGGCDGVSVVKSGQLIGENPVGTMPHSLVLCVGSTLAAIRAYDEVLGPEVKRVALIDTFQDEKFEALAIAQALGERLYAVRFDTPGSRRGNFYRILEETRWELDLRGLGHVKFFASGSINEADIPVLNPVVDGYGVGTAISNAPVVDLAMDIVEIDGKPIAKRGKWSGSKQVLRCQKCGARKIVPNGPFDRSCSCGGLYQELLAPILDHGQELVRFEAASRVREAVLQQVEGLDL